MASNRPVTRRPRKKARKKPVKYKEVSFKLTTGQKKALERYCKVNNLTPVRFMKSLINGHVERYRDEPAHRSYVTKNQLELFDKD